MKLARLFHYITDDNIVITWQSIGVVRQIEIIAGLILMFCIGVVGSVVLTNVWVRKGYEGIDKVLEGKEVALLMSHIFGFGSLEVFCFMIIFKPEINPPSYAFWICGSSFVGTAILEAFNTFKPRSKPTTNE